MRFKIYDRLLEKGYTRLWLWVITTKEYCNINISLIFFTLTFSWWEFILNTWDWTIENPRDNKNKREYWFLFVWIFKDINIFTWQIWLHKYLYTI